MSGRCVCGHIRALHFDGVCKAVLNPCGCTSFERPAEADKPSVFPKQEPYNGVYAGKRWSA